MAQLPQAHHTLRVRDAAAMAALFRALGFREAGEPASAPATALRNPQTGQEVVLLPMPQHADEGLHEGDVSVGIPVGAVDLDACLAALREAAPGLAFGEPEALPKDHAVAVTVDGQRLILTRKRDPFYVIHYSPEGWQAAAPFYEEALGFCFFALPDRGTVVRTRFENAGGRVDIEVSPAVAPDPAGARFRLITGKMAQAQESVAAGQWLEPPAGGTGVVRGPLGELIELVDREAGAP